MPAGMPVYDRMGQYAQPQVPEMPSTGVTTLIIRHVPRGCIQEQLEALWPANCPVCPHNLLYAPHRKSRKGLQGYAFINFLSVHAAERFRRIWQGRVPEFAEWIEAEGFKHPLDIEASRVQGLRKNLVNFAKVDLARLDPALWPVVTMNGQRQNFAQVLRRVSRDSDSHSFVA